MLAMCWPIILSALISERAVLFPGFKGVVRLTIAMFYSMILFAAIVTSHSRMGVAAAVFGVVVWWLVFQRSKFRPTSLRQFPIKLAMLGGLILLFLFTIWFGFDDIAVRYTKLEGGDSRLDVWKATLDLPLGAWLLGIGPGFFESAFHLVQPAHLNVRFVYAHNDYLEFILEFGLILSSILILTIAHWVYKVFPRGSSHLRSGCYGAVAAICLHSVVDFNLQIPGSSMVFWIAIGLIMNPNMTGKENMSGEVNVEPKGQRIVKGLFPQHVVNGLRFSGPTNFNFYFVTVLFL